MTGEDSVSDALNESLNDIYNDVWRPMVGDLKMIRKIWHDSPDRAYFVAWLGAVASFAKGGHTK